MITSGTYASMAGGPLTSYAECVAAAAGLGLSYTSAYSYNLYDYSQLHA